MVDLENPDSIGTFFLRLLKADFMPHGHCFFWRPDILWLHVLSDALIALAYYSIPLMLLYFRKKRKDLPYPWMFALFAAFIFWCGTTHIMNIITLWVPIYRADGIVKLITASISIVTAVLLFPLIPKALTLKSQKEFLEERSRRRQVEDFTHIASHDLKEPLRTISLFSELLSEKDLGVEDKEYLSHISRSSKRLSDLIDDLASYSQIDVTPLVKEKLSLRDCLEVAVESLTSALSSCRGEVHWSFSQEIEVLGVRTQLVQVFQNLLSNAIKFRKPEVPIQIVVDAKVESGAVLLSISDNGLGFDPKFSEHIFIVFKRLHTSEGGYPGTGMGLAICKKVVESHGGQIWVESTPGKGTTFYLRLPR